MRIALWTLLALATMVGLGPSSEAGIVDEDYASFQARITDTQGVRTEIADFGFATGPNLLWAHLGDADVDVPLRKVRTLEIGDLVERTRRAPCKATMRSGKVVQLELENSELTRLMEGSSDVGDLRIRLGKIRRLDLVRTVDDPRP